ncbi:protein FAF-like, chloroplastic [Bidens hawaiensis]|uniref:protein FAF-like, chloroplastic n=1 Tax=Bidens hawaiensis TaxID=980011 RepID=UPI00404B0072
MYLCTSATNSPATSQQFININHMTQMQGIVSILRSDNPEKTTKAASLRRTLSADMSSKRWLPTLKKIASSEHITSSYESNEEEEECHQVNEKSDEQIPSRMDIWTAIMSQKKQDESDKIPPPYVHPLVKKSASSLSEKSLKICTESLGSETGSDVFSSPPASSEKSGDDDQQEEKQKEKEEFKVVKPACLTTKKTQQAQARAFPPSLPSLAAAHAEGPSLHMQSRRVAGRLVVEAVSVPQQKYFEAQRQDGRFLLTLINDPKEQDQEQEPKQQQEQKQPSDQDHDNNNIVSDEKDVGILKPVINVHKSSVTIKRILDRDNENPSWSQKFNTGKMAKLEGVEYAAPIKQSPPPRSRAAGLPPLPPPPTTVNSYQYFWRAKPTVASVIDPMITQQQPPAKTKDLVLLRGNKADCFLPSLKCCKEPRRSLLMWEPFCIATS